MNTGIKNSKERALAENSIAKFLVDYCDEGPELEASGVELYNTYVKFFQNYNKFSFGRKSTNPVVYLQNYTMYKLLSECGFIRNTREEPGPKGGIKKVVYFKGVALKKFDCEFDRQAASLRPEHGDGMAEFPTVLKPHRTHVTINNVLYERSMIATIRPIKGFLKHGTNEMMRAIVTFKNSELRHQFITEKESKRIEEQLLGVYETV